ncbi:MAG TPA: GGDEF domain-containing protein [Bacilli bacterium]|nr:GGDEF domain-containing protein [Bacilli bacterium]
MEHKRPLYDYLHFLFTRRKDRPTIQLDIVVGMISSFVLALIYFTVYFYYEPHEVLFLPLYLIAALVMFIQFGIFVWMFTRKAVEISKVDYILVKQHTFLIMSIGIAISAIHLNYDRQMISFVVAIISSAIVSSHRPLTSIILYGSALLVYGVVMSFFHYDVVRISSLIQNSLYFSIVALFYSFVSHYRITREIKQNKDLVSEVEKNKKLISNLTSMNQEITRNNEISKVMMYLMSEIIRFESLDAFFDLVLQKAIEIIPNAQKGSVLVVKENKLEYKAAYGYDLNQLHNIKLNIEDSFQFKLEQLYDPYIIKDLRDFNTAYLANEKLAELNKINALEAKAVLTCAFSIKNQFYGSINIDNVDDSNAFSEEDKILIKHLATQIEVALYNKSLLDDMLYMSRHDSLTKLYTRKYFEELVEKLFEDARKNQYPFTLCIIDTNDLKKFNDQYGHFAGDRFLEYFATMLKKTLGEAVTYGRTGGDEFTIFFQRMNQIEATKIVKKMYQELETTPFTIYNSSFIPSFSYGMAEYPIDSTDLVTLTALADKRMYIHKDKSKKQKSNNVSTEA